MTIANRGIRTLGMRVNALRRRKGLSKAGLAKAAGVSPTCVWNWEEGNTYPRPESLARLAKALGTTPIFLEGGLREPQDAQPQGEAGEARSPLPLPQLIEDARLAIAGAAGLPVAKVRVVLEYGD